MPRRLYVLKLLLTAGALAALGFVVDWGEIARAGREASHGWALAALALLPVNVGLEAYRWHRLVVRIAPAVRFRTALAAVVSGYPLGQLTPGRVGDYVGRALYLREVPAGASAALTFAERMATLACCLVFGLAALPFFFAADVELAAVAWAGVVAVAAGGTAGLLVCLLHPGLGRRVLSALLPFARPRRALATLDRFDGADAARLLALSALRYAVFSTQFVLLVRAFDPGAPVLASYVGVALVFFAKSAIPSVTLGDLGVRESAAVFFLGLYGVAEAAAFNASLGLFAVNILVPALAGLALLPRLRLAAAPAAPVPVAEEPAPVPA
ncbi:MAG TPA: lysylphosphatidylglycerol synthase transmembrane domain-containing protein [Rubricoccaceae bacterium]|nr:lysylphosphatidylglycerol synthase transmembrane domain-containing protein [Rubricoccaceae bacterium]